MLTREHKPLLWGMALDRITKGCKRSSPHRFKWSTACIGKKHLLSTNHLTATILSSSFLFLLDKSLLSTCGKQAAKHTGLLIQLFVPCAALQEGVTPGQIHTGVRSFHLRAVDSSITSCIASTSFISVPVLSSSLHNL